MPWRNFFCNGQSPAIEGNRQYRAAATPSRAGPVAQMRALAPSLGRPRRLKIVEGRPGAAHQVTRRIIDMHQQRAGGRTIFAEGFRSRHAAEPLRGGLTVTLDNAIGWRSGRAIP